MVHLGKKGKKVVCKGIKPPRKQIAEVFYSGPVALTLVKKVKFPAFRRWIASILFVMANIMLGLILWASWSMISMQEINLSRHTEAPWFNPNHVIGLIYVAMFSTEPLPIYIEEPSTMSTNRTRSWMTRPTTTASESADTDEPSNITITPTPATPVPSYAIKAADDVATRVSIGIVHHSLCTIGFLLFYCNGLLVATPYFGASRSMIKSHRRYEHTVLTIFGIFFTAAGSVLYIFSQGIQFQAHSTAGVMLTLMTVCSVLTGMTASAVISGSGIFPLLVRMVHSAFGIAAFLFGLQCQLSGMQMNTYYYKPLSGYKNNVHTAMNKLLLPAVVIFGGIVVLRPVMTCVGLNLFYTLKYQPCICKKAVKTV